MSAEAQSPDARLPVVESSVGSGATMNGFDPFQRLVEAIGSGSVQAVRYSLSSCDEHGIDLKSRKVSSNNLTVFGHILFSNSDPEVVDILFTRPDFNVNRLEHDFPGILQPAHLLYIAACAGNTEGVRRICSSQNLNLTVGLAPSSTVLHMMAARSRDTAGIRLILDKAQHILPPEEFARFLNGRDKLRMAALHYAAWEGFEDIVALLLDYKDAIDVNARGWKKFTALHLAAWTNRPGVVDLLLAHPHIDPLVKSGSLSSLPQIHIKSSKVPNLRDPFYICNTVAGDPRDETSLQAFPLMFREAAWKSPFLYPELYNSDATGLHCAVLKGHVEIVDSFVRGLSSKVRLKKVLNAVDDHLMTPLHYATIRGDASIVEQLLTCPTVRGNLEESRQNLTPLDMAYILIQEAQRDDNALHEYKVMISMLQQRPDIKASIEILYKDRQVFVDAANTILVGAALIASISFAGWLQPPLGYQPYYDRRYLVKGSAPPETFEPYAAVREHVTVRVFWIFNSLSFCFAIATMLTGAGAVLPSRAIVGRPEVEHIRTLLIRASAVLSFSVFFVLGAFMAAGFSSLPPTLDYEWGMIATSVVGGLMCLIVMYYYYRRLFRLFGFGNSPLNVHVGFQDKVGHVWHVLMDHKST